VNTFPRYEVHHTRAGRHVVFVAGNGEPVLSGEVLTSRGAALSAILSVASAHSPVGHASINPDDAAVAVWGTPPEGRGTTIPIVWIDDRKPKLIERAFARVGRSIVGTPKDVQARAAVGWSYAGVPDGVPVDLTHLTDEPVRNGDSHDA
jgi:uncharacterized protein YegP (UPF0339 family)